ncbi:MAG: glycosyltransferase family 4 protein [Candidatus Nealsonbacteria bacterium]
MLECEMTMRLLVITQKVDLNDDILGFFHHWLEKLSKRFDSLNVICLQAGKYSLPQNVRVFSLGKEKGRSRARGLFRFYRYIWQLRKNHEAVFVHMNPVYVVLGGIFWKLQQKKIYLWHNHRHGNIITRIAIWLSCAVFYTSPFSFSARFKKSKMMPVGIDTDIFKKFEQIKKIPRSIIYAGRFSAVKNVDTLIEAADLLDKRGADFILNIVGRAGDDEQENFRKIKVLARNLEIKGKIKFLGGVTHQQIPALYNQNDIFVNLTQTGSFDKTTLEAMACQNIVLVSNQVFKDIFPEEWRKALMFKERDPEDLAEKLLYLTGLADSEKDSFGAQLREIVVKNHDLNNLIEKLTDEFNQK